MQTDWTTKKRFYVHECLRFVYSARENQFMAAPASLRNVRPGQILNEKITTNGLSSFHVEKLREQYGENLIEMENPTYGAVVREEFTGSFFYVFQLMTFWLWLSIDEWHIGFLWEVIFIVVGFWKAAQQLRNLEQVAKLAQLTTTVTVVREGKKIQIKSDELVPWDVLELKPGLLLTCDCVLIEGDVIVNEAALTGEGTPVQKFVIEKDEDDEGLLTFVDPTSAQFKNNFLFAGTSLYSCRGKKKKT